MGSGELRVPHRRDRLSQALPEEATSESVTSDVFCDADADIVFKSSDGIYFLIHRKYLESGASRLLPAAISDRNSYYAPPSPISSTAAHTQPTLLPESAPVLEILFSFLYPRRHPSLRSIAFTTLIPLVEASEKYEAFAAMNICHERMREAMYEHPTEVLNYAAKYNYPELLDDAALLVLDVSLSKIAESMDRELIPHWLRYYDTITRGIQTIPSSHFTFTSNTGIKPSGVFTLELCPHWDQAIKTMTVSQRMKDLLRDKACAESSLRPAVKACDGLRPISSMDSLVADLTSLEKFSDPHSWSDSSATIVNQISVIGDERVDETGSGLEKGIGEEGCKRSAELYCQLVENMVRHTVRFDDIRNGRSICIV